MVFVIRHVVMTAQHPYSVAISFPCRNNFDKNQAIPCRNNFDKNQANFLESAQNPRTFATSKRSYVSSFLIYLFWLFG